MDDVLKDKRFSNVISNPRFKGLRKEDRKIKIDDRFQAMFTDPRFQVKYKVDERGREINKLQSENYKKYYELSGSSSDSESGKESGNEVADALKTSVSSKKKDFIKCRTKNSFVVEDLDEIQPEEDVNSSEGDFRENKDDTNFNDQDGSLEKKKQRAKIQEAHKNMNIQIDKIHKVKFNDKIREKLSDISVDYARGYGNLMSGSESSSDESSSEESEGEFVEHPWGELDKDAERTEETSRRLAVCHMDWDRVTAKDIMVLLHSFLPVGGRIESVTIYPSEFGLARMAEEELEGPKEIADIKAPSDIGSDEEAEEGSSYQMEKLREYQLKRLRYYYAVVVCDSEQTAGAIYAECDGIEYESSATKLDLRFISDDVLFDGETPRDTCTALPDLKAYRPRAFVNKALQQGKVELTWDETDPDRLDFNRKVTAGEEVAQSEVAAYLAVSSTEDEDEEERKGKGEDENERESDEEGKTEEERIQKYRSLVALLEDGGGGGKGQRKKRDVEVEVSWGHSGAVGSKELGAKEYTYKSVASLSSGGEDSDDLITNIKDMKNRKKQQEKKLNDEDSDPEAEKQKRELELLLAEDAPELTTADRRHFSLKEIERREKEGVKKRKWKRKGKKDIQVEEDSFRIDTEDNRFSALFTSHHFNIDPADPHFRKTKAMAELITEKQKRRRLDSPA